MMGFELIFIAVIIGAIAFALGWRPQFIQNNTAQIAETPSDILKARFARGEITREEYEQMLGDLEG